MGRYRAFISYNQKDKSVVKRLHRWLETYRVPRGGARSADLAPGRRLGRFFRDDEEMAASPDIGGTVRGAIEDAESLVVICSPNAAQSKWVDAEIRHFRETGRERKVFAVMVAGTPNSGDPKTECFPPSLRVAADPDDPDSMPIEPLALDLRKEGRARLLARLAAGLLEVDFDALWNRDRRRARARRDTVLSSLLGGVIALSLTGAVVLRGQNGERSEQLVSAAQAQAEAGAHESALRLSVLSLRDNALLPAARDGHALLSRASHESLALSAYSWRDGAVTAIAASSDGRWLASAWDDVFVADGHGFTLFDRSGQRAVDRLDPAPAGRVEALAFSPDSARLVVAENGAFPKVYDLQNGAVLFELEGVRYVPAQMDAHSPAPTEEVGEFSDRIVFSPDGRLIAANSSLGGIRVWDAATGAPLMRHPAVEDLEELGPSNPPMFSRIQFTPDGRLLSEAGTAWGTDTVVVHEPASSRPVFTLSRPDRDDGIVPTLEAFTVSGDSRLLVASWRDGFLASWDLQTGELVTRFLGMESGFGERGLFIDQSRNRLTALTQTGSVQAWSLQGDPLFVVAGPGQRLQAVASDADQRSALMLFEGGLARRVDLATAQIEREHQAQISEVSYGAIASDQHGTVFTGHDSGSIRGWRLPRISTHSPFPDLRREPPQPNFGPNYAESLTLSADGRTLLTKYAYAQTSAWRLNEETEPRIIGPANRQVVHAAINRDGSLGLLDFGRRLSGKTLWDLRTGRQIAAFGEPVDGEAYEAAVSVSFSADDQAILIGSERLSAHLFRQRGASWTLTHTLALPLEDHEDLFLEGNVPTTAVALAPDGTRALTAFDSGLIQIWNTESGAIIEAFESAADGVVMADFAPDGAAVALMHRNMINVGDRAPLISIWRRSGEGEQERWRAHQQIFVPQAAGGGLRFSQDGARLIASSGSGLYVFDVESGRELAFEAYGLSPFRATTSLTPDGSGFQLIAESTFRQENEPRSSAFGLAGLQMSWDLQWVLGAEDRARLGLGPLRERVCDPVNGLLRGELRLITSEDIDAVPSLAGRAGEDVCRSRSLTEQLAEVLPALGDHEAGAEL